jgi:eukaryotic-like serine/threonine-protein kinase
VRLLEAESIPSRFRIVRQLGAGAYGEVYEADDRERDRRVALKLLRNLDPRALYRFKREFRALAEIRHENLVRLDELFSVDDLWFFTMELVEGVHFIERLHPGTTSSDNTAADTATFDAPLPSQRAPHSAPAIGPLRRAMRQLAAGVDALHRLGMLHRDLKPSNVLVTDDDHVVILDFGLVADFDAGGVYESLEMRVGTPAYMAPEQAAGLPVTAAADWYAVGVMLYQALTRQLPFLGAARGMMLAKQAGDGPDPRHLDATLPADLAELSRDLMVRDPLRRPGPEEILARLAAVEAPARSVAPRTEPEVPLVGRDTELARLEEAFATTRAGKMAAVFVSGASGIGKSALVRRFVDTLRGGAVVLEGRCFERESVAYNALDAVVDALSGELRRVDPLELAKLTPRHLPELCSVFPVLGRVASFGAEAERGSLVLDPLEVRRRAFAAFRQLLGRLAERRALVLCIDDLQWGDADSGLGLTQLFDAPDPPAMLFVGIHRRDAAESGPLPELLRDFVSRAPWLSGTSIELEPLDATSSRALARALLADEPALDVIVSEAGGHPYLVAELARAEAGRRGSLAQLIDGRVAELSAGARGLLEAVAIAGRPVSRRVAIEAARGCDDGDVATLVAARLLRTAGRGSDAVETYHDRIRETVRAGLPPRRVRRLHRRLATALGRAPGTPAQVLVMHFVAAGVKNKARAYACRAADEAVRALAFERAAELYQVALDQLGEDDVAARAELSTLLAISLGNAGRGADAAAAYLRAAEDDPERAFELTQRASTALFLAGHVDDGLDVGRASLERLGISPPRTQRAAYWLGLSRVAWFLVRGVRFRERDAGDVDDRTLLRLDSMLALAMGLAFADTIRSLYFSMRFILLALRTGEPHRVGLAMMVAVMWLAALFRPASPHPAKWLRSLETLAEQLDSPRLRASAALADGFRCFCAGEWRNARDRLAEAEATFLEHCKGIWWELSWARIYHLWSLYHLGEVGELATRAPALVEAGKQRDDLSLGCRASTASSSTAWLVRDDVAGALHAAEESLRRWPRQQPVIHYLLMLSYRHIYLYEGDAERLHADVRERWPIVQRSGLLRLRLVRLYAYHTRAVASLALAATRKAAGRDELLAEVERDLAEMPTELAGSTSLAALVRGAVASLRGDERAAVAHVREAVAGFAAADMKLYVAVARIVLGYLAGARKGAAKGERFMRAQGIVRPERFVAMLAPGFRDPARHR